MPEAKGRKMQYQVQFVLNVLLRLRDTGRVVVAMKIMLSNRQIGFALKG